MKTIDLLGGMSWKSSVLYYRIINSAIRERWGGSHSARSLVLSVDFAEVQRLQRDGEWGALTTMMVDAGLRLERSGVAMVLICTNTMHLIAEEVAAADRTRSACQSRVGLLGTAFSMDRPFYKDRLRDGTAST